MKQKPYLICAIYLILVAVAEFSMTLDYPKILPLGMVSLLEHATYLSKELTKPNSYYDCIVVTSRMKSYCNCSISCGFSAQKSTDF